MFTKLPCVIFAGGKSSRMGEDKALLPFASYSTLTEYQYQRLSKIFQNVYISCKESSNFSFDAHFIEDTKESNIYAPTVGFTAAFKRVTEDRFFALSVDSPFINEKIITTLIENDKEDADATIAKTDEGIQPLCGIYHRSLESKFQKMVQEENHKLGYLLKESKTTYCYFNDIKHFLNMNHPEDYQKALSLINSLL
jgi:molybdopterin-guanine dinucleotide biosynthesis protein A